MLIQLKTLSYKVILLSMVVGLLGFTIALAASGDLDTTFDSDGRVTSFAVNDSNTRADIVQDIAIQADGKIVAAGYSYLITTISTRDFAVLRYNANGTLDTTFSGDGRLVTNLGAIDSAFEVAIQPNGKIVTSGQICSGDGSICDVALVRYNVGGALDTTFSGDGKLTTDFGGSDNGSSGGLAIQSDGKIVVAGYRNTFTDYNVAIYRYTTDGTLDTTFSGDGVAVGNFGSGNFETLHALVLQSDGKIVVAGESSGNFAIARLNSNGTADLTFSGDGRQTTNFGVDTDDRAYGLALQPDGKIVVVGEKCLTICSFAIARYNPNGSLDTTFNTTGRKVFTFAPGQESGARDVLVMSNGNIVVAGRATIGTPNFGMARLLPSGAFDTTFSGNGKANIDFGSSEFANALARQPADGNYVLAGYAYVSSNLHDFALARILP